MIAIAGGIVLAVIALNVIGALGRDAQGEFSMAVLFGNAFEIVMTLALILGIVGVIAYAIMSNR